MICLFIVSFGDFKERFNDYVSNLKLCIISLYSSSVFGQTVCIYYYFNCALCCVCVSSFFLVLRSSSDVN